VLLHPIQLLHSSQRIIVGLGLRSWAPIYICNTFSWRSMIIEKTAAP